MAECFLNTLYFFFVIGRIYSFHERITPQKEHNLYPLGANSKVVDEKNIPVDIFQTLFI